MTILLITIRQNSNIVFFFLKKSEIQASSICFISYENNFFFQKKKKRVTCHRQWWRRWLKWWTWLSFLDADSILRHEYFFPNNVLKFKLLFLLIQRRVDCRNCWFIYIYIHFNTQLQSGYNEKNREDNKEKIGDWSSLVNLCLCTH